MRLPGLSGLKGAVQPEEFGAILLAHLCLELPRRKKGFCHPAQFMDISAGIDGSGMQFRGKFPGEGAGHEFNQYQQMLRNFLLAGLRFPVRRLGQLTIEEQESHHCGERDHQHHG
jgi:hypothetical protein